MRAGSRWSLILATAGALVLLAAPARTHAQILQQDKSLPIEITADSLEVLQKENIATFTGNVDAVQGDTVLSADKLRVHYRNDQEAGTTSSSASPASGGAIQRIEAEGHVFLSSPRETAQGNVGVYDVAGNRLTLEGAVVFDSRRQCDPRRATGDRSGERSLAGVGGGAEQPGRHGAAARAGNLRTEEP